MRSIIFFSSLIFCLLVCSSATNAFEKSNRVVIMLDISNHEENSKRLPKPYFFDNQQNAKSLDAIMIKLPHRPSFFVKNITAKSDNTFSGFVDSSSSSSFCADSNNVHFHPVSIYNKKNFHLGSALASKIEFLSLSCSSSSSSSSSSQQQNIPKSKYTTTYMLYDVWHAYASTAVRTQSGGNVTSVETILQSNGNMRLENVYSNPGAAAGFYYHSTPANLGPYCLYRKRQNETSGVLPDCPNINVTARQHAIMLNALGVDVVVVDGTNLGTFTSFSDALQLRPMEVLAEEWYKLRTVYGMATPSIAAWNTVPSGSNLWQNYLNNIYNDPQLSTLIARAPAGVAAAGKQIFFIPNGDPAVIAQVESNFGRNNVAVLTMWANWPASQFVSEGAWQFMAPCQDASNGNQYTTSVANLPECNQLVVPRSILGTSTTVSPSYQLGYGSLPFQAAGKLNTFTLELQFATALDAKTDNLVLSTFNEFIAQPQSNPYAAQFGANKVFSMGIGSWDASFNGDALWVDTYGFSLARDIEPSEEGGSAIFNVVASCTRLKEHLSFSSSSKATLRELCQQENFQPELCCSRYSSSSSSQSAVNQTRRNIWALKKVQGNTDYLLTNNQVELDGLLNSGQWAQLCNPFGGPQSFCVDLSILGGADAGSLPFLLATTPSDPWLGANGGVGLYRCLEGGILHFFSTDPNCEGQKTEYFLGFAASVRNSEFPRAIRRCIDPSQGGTHFHSLDLPCQHGHEEVVYGYVH
jgi:hypothetical protein